MTTDFQPASTAMRRADELLRQMSIEEKAMQLSSVVPLALLGTAGPMRGQLDTLLNDGCQKSRASLPATRNMQALCNSA